MHQEVDGSVCAAAWFSNLDRRAQSVTVTMGPDGVPGDGEGPPEAIGTEPHDGPRHRVGGNTQKNL